MKQMDAQSTVALTAYNIVCMAAGALTRDMLWDRVMDVQQHPGLSREWFDAALDGVVARKFMAESGDGLNVIDSKRRRVVNRDRSDGDKPGALVTGGWKRWMVQCRTRGILTLDEAMKE